MSDTRTNAGVDNISVFKKMFTWSKPGERLITIMTAGNLATTQAVVSLLDERTKAVDERNPSILDEPSMFQVVRLVGNTLKEVIQQNAETGQSADSSFNATIIVGGQIDGGQQRLFLVYPEGNFVEASDDTPFFQIGETKYGKPILVRAYHPEISFESAMKLMLVSFDSTMKANLSVGMPFDFQVHETNKFEVQRESRMTNDDPYFEAISRGWGTALNEALESLPDYQFTS